MPQVSKGARLYPYRRKGRPAVYIIRDGRHFRSTGFTLEQRDEADQALADYIGSKRPNTNRTDISKIWVAEVLKLYVQDTPENKPSKALIGFHMKRLEPFWGDKKLSDVKKSVCNAYVKFRVSNKEKPVKESTVRRELKTLQAAIVNWHKESPLEAVPQVTLPEEAPPQDRVLERDEVARMLWACRKRKWKYVARFILIGVYTGTRHSAILRLGWTPALTGGHIDLKRGILYRRGKAERDTSKRRPPVRLPLRLQSHISRWARQADPTQRVIRAPDGSAFSTRLRKAWHTIRTDAGLGPEVKPHTLRHTCATWNLWAGKTIWDVGGIIGADATTVQKVYGHHLIKDERAKA